MFLLYVSSLYVLIIALLTTSKQCVSGVTSPMHKHTSTSHPNTCTSTSSHPHTGNPPLPLHIPPPQKTESARQCCWETTIGQELYKLTITHFIADVASILLLEGLRWLLSRVHYCSKKMPWVSTPCGLWLDPHRPITCVEKHDVHMKAMIDVESAWCNCHNDI